MKSGLAIGLATLGTLVWLIAVLAVFSSPPRQPPPPLGPVTVITVTVTPTPAPIQYDPPDNCDQSLYGIYQCPSDPPAPPVVLR